jgi:D-sedoheptulose 7-phosphate isomerase
MNSQADHTQQLNTIFKQSLATKQEFTAQIPKIVDAVQLIEKCFNAGGKLLTCGNGGSAADAQHFSAELMARYKKERKALPAIALTADISFLTAWSNDYDYESVFARQIEGLGKSEDVLVCFSTSGNSKNVVSAAQLAKKMGLQTICFTGNNGGALADLADVLIDVPSPVTARIQECHILAYHSICEILDERFFRAS